MAVASKRLLKRIAEPLTEPLTLAEAKLYLRIDGSEEDDLVTTLISVARQHAENYLRRSLMTQTWRLAMDDAFPTELLLPMGPVQSVEGVTSIDEAGDETEVAEALYRLNAAKDTLLFEQTAMGARVEVEYEAGYGAAEDVPAPIRQGMLSHIAAMYECRGEQALPPEALAFYQPYREVRL